MSNMGTQYRFTLEDTNRDGGIVPDVFVVGDDGKNAVEFFGYLMQKSGDFYDAVLADRRIYREAGYAAGKEEVYADIVKWWVENGRNPNDSVQTLIEEWQLPTQRTFTATVHFEDIDAPLVITGIEAEDEEEAESVVSDGISASWSFDYSGPGDVDDDPFGDSTIYISSIDIEEEEV